VPIGRALSSAGERSLHTGEVVGSIPTAPTKKLQQKHDLDERPLPVLPVVRCEQGVNSPSKLGENPGNLFDRCSARNRSTTPRRRPPDHENSSPGAAGTATGADIQSVPRRTTPNHRKIVAHASPTTPVRPAPPLRIVIEPTASGRKWTARLGDRVLCVSAWPFVGSARHLLDESYPADAVIEMWRPNTEEWALQGRLGAVAAAVIDGKPASHRAKNGSPARNSERGGSRARHRFALVRGSLLGVDDDAFKRSGTPKLWRTKEVA
jgi:hypothetical protein